MDSEDESKALVTTETRVTPERAMNTVAPSALRCRF
jgi:hypothetical protein